MVTHSSINWTHRRTTTLIETKWQNVTTKINLHLFNCLTVLYFFVWCWNSTVHLQVGPGTGLLALAVLKKDQQLSAHDLCSGIMNRRPQLLKGQYSYEQTEGSCGALNLSMKVTPSERLVDFSAKSSFLFSYSCASVFIYSSCLNFLQFYLCGTGRQSLFAFNASDTFCWKVFWPTEILQQQQ